MESGNRNDRPELDHSTRLADAGDAERYVGNEWSKQRVFDRHDWLFSYDATAIKARSGFAASLLSVIRRFAD